MKKIISLSLMIAMPMIANAQLQNLDFEQWQNNPTDESFPNKPTGWTITDGFNDAEHCMYPPATDAQNGYYALTLGIWYHYVKDAARQTATINYRPVTLKGHYKYTDNIIQGDAGPVNDVAQVNVYLTKWNPVLSQNDTIGRGTLDLHESLDYSSFSCPVTYSSDAIPDKVTIYLDCTRIKRAGETESLIRMEGDGSYFTVDNISLEENTMGIGDFNTLNALIYPNPVKESVTIANFSGHAELYDMAGKLLLSTPVTESPVGLQQFQKGIYTLKLTDGNSIKYSKLIKE